MKPISILVSILIALSSLSLRAQPVESGAAVQAPHTDVQEPPVTGPSAPMEGADANPDVWSRSKSGFMAGGVALLIQILGQQGPATAFSFAGPFLGAAHGAVGGCVAWFLAQRFAKRRVPLAPLLLAGVLPALGFGGATALLYGGGFTLAGMLMCSGSILFLVASSASSFGIASGVSLGATVLALVIWGGGFLLALPPAVASLTVGPTLIGVLSSLLGRPMVPGEKPGMDLFTVPPPPLPTRPTPTAPPTTPSRQGQLPTVRLSGNVACIGKHEVVRELAAMLPGDVDYRDVDVDVEIARDEEGTESAPILVKIAVRRGSPVVLVVEREFRLTEDECPDVPRLLARVVATRLEQGSSPGE